MTTACSHKHVTPWPFCAKSWLLVRFLPEGRKHPASTRAVARPPAPSRQAAFLFLHRPSDLTAEEQETVTQLRQLHPEVDLAYDLVQQFTQMIRTRTAEQLDDWLERIASSSLTDLHPFGAGISQDKAAVQAGLTLPWSQGQIEGQMTRLKLIKRQGYGRAKFDLLRQRVLHAA